jgi:hypothetical protein
LPICLTMAAQCKHNFATEPSIHVIDLISSASARHLSNPASADPSIFLFSPVSASGWRSLVPLEGTAAAGGGLAR